MVNVQHIEEAGQYARAIIEEALDAEYMNIFIKRRSGEELALTYQLSCKSKNSSHHPHQAIIASEAYTYVSQSKQAICSSTEKVEDGTAIEGLEEKKSNVNDYYAAAPILIDGEVLGVISVSSRSIIQNEEKAIIILKAMAAMIGQVISLKEMSIRDSLTGLYNRNFIEELDQYWASQLEKPYIAIMFIDIDDFKSINDNYGHIDGDKVLRSICDRLSHTISNHAMMIRMGGDEFIVIKYLNSKEGIEGMFSLAERLQEQLLQPIQLSRGSITATISIGISCGSLERLTLQELLEEADQAMFSVKAQGKGACKLSNMLQP